MGKKFIIYIYIYRFGRYESFPEKTHRGYLMDNKKNPRTNLATLTRSELTVVARSCFDPARVKRTITHYFSRIVYIHDRRRVHSELLSLSHYYYSSTCKRP